MRLKSFIMGCLAVTFLSSSLVAFAGEKQIPCPPASLIKNLWGDVNTVSVYYGNSGEKVFFASAQNSTLDQGNQLYWNVYSLTNAKDFNTAFIMGQNDVKKVYNVRNKYAQKGTTNGYFCSYVDNAGNFPVYAWGYKSEQDSKNAEKEILSLQH